MNLNTNVANRSAKVQKYKTKIFTINFVLTGKTFWL